MEVVVYLFITPACIACYCLIINYLKICKERWKIFYVLRFLFGNIGIPIYTHPRALVDKLIFTSIVLLSIQYSVKFYSSFLNVEMVQNEIPPNTLEEIINHVFASDNVLHIQNMKPQTHVVDDISTCVENVRRHLPSITPRMDTDNSAQ